MAFTAQQVYNLMMIEAKKLQQQYPKWAGIPIDEWVKTAVAICSVESTFNPLAKNKKSSASGLMQIVKQTKKEIETKYLEKKSIIGDLFDAKYNVKLGLALIAYRYLRPTIGNQDWDKTIVSYKMGHYDTKGLSYLREVKKHSDKIDFASLESGYNDYSSLSTFKKYFGNFGEITSPQFASPSIPTELKTPDSYGDTYYEETT